MRLCKAIDQTPASFLRHLQSCVPCQYACHWSGGPGDCCAVLCCVRDRLAKAYVGYIPEGLTAAQGGVDAEF